MKPLTIEELKALPVGEWVWVDFIIRNEKFYAQIKKNNALYADLNSLRLWQEFDYSDYGTKWIAYKNKEQAEACKTNADWLKTLSNKELAQFLCGDDFNGIKMGATSSVGGVEQWLAMDFVGTPEEIKQKIAEAMK